MRVRSGYHRCGPTRSSRAIGVEACSAQTPYYPQEVLVHHQLETNERIMTETNGRTNRKKYVDEKFGPNTEQHYGP